MFGSCLNKPKKLENCEGSSIQTWALFLHGKSINHQAMLVALICVLCVYTHTEGEGEGELKRVEHERVKGCSCSAYFLNEWAEHKLLN